MSIPTAAEDPVMPRLAPLFIKVGRKAGPTIVIATIVPGGLFLLGHRLWGLVGGVLLALVGSTATQALHVLRGRPLSTLLVFSSAEVLLRSGAAVALKSASTYFLVPSVVTAVTGIVLINSAFRSTRLLDRLVDDLIPSSVLESVPRAPELIRTLAVAYGAEQIIVSGASVLMYLNVPVTIYAALHPILSPLFLGVAIVAAAPRIRRAMWPDRLCVMGSKDPSR